MLRRRWWFIEGLIEAVPPTAETHLEDSKRVSKKILKSHRAESDFDTQVALDAVSSILVDVVKDDKNVITPEDIQSAVELGGSGASTITPPQLEIEIHSWLPSAGLLDIDASYCQYEEWNQSGKIYIAPVFPRLEDVVSELGNPIAITTTTIRRLLIRAFSEASFLADDVYGDRAPEVDGADIDAFLAGLQYQLENDWIRISTNLDKEYIWLNPQRIDKILRSSGSAILGTQLTQIIYKSILSAPHIGEGIIPELRTADLKDILDVLRDSYDWYRLVTGYGTWWYPQWEAFDTDYYLYATEAQECYNTWMERSPEELRAAKVFFAHNQQALLRKEDTNIAELEQLVRHLEVRIQTRQEEATLTSASPGDEFSSEFEAEAPTEYHVAKELEKELQERRAEEEEELDKGLSGIQY